MAGMENDIKLKGEEINTVKKCKDELITRISQLEDELKAAKIREKSKPTEFMLHSKFTDISKLEDNEEVFSTPTVSAGINWKLCVCKGDYRIYFYLCAEKEDSVEWFCPVIAEFRVISQKSDEIVHRREMKWKFDAQESLSYIESISVNDVDKEFVVDDSITVAIAIKAFPICLHEATKMPLRFLFSDISKLKYFEPIYSEPTEVEGITWNMSMCKDADADIEINLHVEKKEDVKWWCAVIVDLQLISQTSGEIDHIKRVKMMYDAENSSAFIGYILKEDLSDEKKGFVKEDSIIVDATVSVFLID